MSLAQLQPQLVINTFKSHTFKYTFNIKKKSNKYKHRKWKILRNLETLNNSYQRTYKSFRCRIETLSLLLIFFFSISYFLCLHSNWSEEEEKDQCQPHSENDWPVCERIRVFFKVVIHIYIFKFNKWLPRYAQSRASNNFNWIYFYFNTNKP